MQIIELNVPTFPATIPALSFGDTNKPLILAIHGWLDNAASFVPLASLLNDYHVIAIDLPGHGLFDHASFKQSYQVDCYLALLLQLIDTLSDQPMIVMGHSLGGAIASVLAARHPDKINHLILLDILGPLSADMLTDNPTLQTNAQAMRDAARYASTKQYPSLESMIQVRMKANDLTHAQAKFLVERGAQEIETGWKWSFDPRITHASSFYYAEKDVLAMLDTIECPVLVVAGDAGIFKGRDFYQTRLEHIKHLTYQQIKGSHHMHMQSAKEVAGCIQAFLKITES